MGKIIKSIIAVTLFIATSSVANASCEADFTTSCDSAMSAMEFYNDLQSELENRLTNCEGDKCKKFNSEMNRVNSCLQEVISHHNTACSIGFNEDMTDTELLVTESAQDPKSKMAMLEN